MTLPLQTPPTRAALRKLLAAVLRADADLDAFCLDHFFQVKHRYFADGMSRNVKTALAASGRVLSLPVCRLLRGHPF